MDGQRNRRGNEPKLTLVLTRFVNRSTDDFHQAILKGLVDKGPCASTVLAYRAELNDKQIHGLIDFLAERKLITKTVMTPRKIMQMKGRQQYSLSTKALISITDKGRKYLRMLEELNSIIDWNVIVEENRKNHRYG
jgi:predicted transcriptional regulator